MIAKRQKPPKCPSTWVCKQTAVKPYNRLLFHHKKKWSTYTRYDTDEPWKHQAKWKKPDTKGHILYDSIYMKCPKIGKSIESRLVFTRGWELEGDC